MFATLHRLVESTPAVRAWFLDSPAENQPTQLTEQGLRVAGWLLTQTSVSSAFIVVRTGEGAPAVEQALPLNELRPDVIQSMLWTEPEGHPQLGCGFSGFVPASVEAFALGVSLGGEVTWLAEVRLLEQLPAKPEEPPPQVLFGREGWLFLDNDTNHSVDQHTGRLLLNDAQLADWQWYFQQCRRLAAKAGVRHAILIAAAKAQVLSDYYPHPKGKWTVSDQVLALAAPADHVVASASVLAREPDREACFIKTDTHWTDRGALRVTLALLEELGLDAVQAERHFAADKYFTLPFVGDLGVKRTPPVAADTEFLLGPRADADAVFDSGRTNTGRVLLFENPQAFWPLHLLLFGASSAYALLKYLKRLFRRTLYVHSAGCVDTELLQREQPDLLVLQTTARFMIVPPHTAFHADAAAGLPPATQKQPRCAVV